MDLQRTAVAGVLTGDGLIAVSGADARAFLHAQLTNDILHLPARQARRAGWCSAKGRLLAIPLVVPQAEQFLLRIPAEILPATLKRLQMFVLRSKVKLADVSADWTQIGLWGENLAARCAELGIALPDIDLGVAEADDLLAVRVGAARCLLLSSGAAAEQRLASLAPAGDAADWALQDLRDGLPQIFAATQDLFVPQMVNLQLVHGVDFQKGCYPGQEVVARTQYRGQLKRRMVRLRSVVSLRPAQDLYSDAPVGEACGSVVSAAQDEALAVVQIATLESGAAIRAAPHGPVLEILPLPYAA